jgi:serine/threonine protein kinase
MVAAKVVLARTEIDLDVLLRFQQEGAMLATLSHPNIVRIHDTFAEQHACCIIMELLDGPTLGQILRTGPLPLPRAKRLALQVAAALTYAHAQGIVHRDIKPDNIVVVSENQVKVTDFGIARLLQPDALPQTIATTGMRMGTPLYMAPEQVEGKKVDGRTDIYAFGALLFHMVTGRPPFEGEDALVVAIKHVQDDPPRPSSLNPAIPAAWDALIQKTLAKDPGRRFQSAKELEAAIAALHAEARVVARPLVRRPRLAAVAGLLAMLVAVAVGVWAHASTATRPPSLAATVDAYLGDLAAHQQLSGSVLVARQGEVVLEKGYGLADRLHRFPNTPAVTYPAVGVSDSFSILGAL